MAHLEVFGAHGREVLALDAERLSIGKSKDCDVALPEDGAVSRVHLMLERVGSVWCLTDLGSRNGTFVNGERLFSARTLRDGDEVALGKSRVVFRDGSTSDDTSTDVIDPPPQLTPREKDVLLELCRPVLMGDVFVQPASVHEIAQALFVVDAAVKQHLLRMYDKFGIVETDGVPRRVRLANAAVRSGAVTMADLRKHPQG